MNGDKLGRWAAAGLSAASTVTVCFAVTFLAAEKTAWWWLVLALGALGLTVGAVWFVRAQKEHAGRSASASVNQSDAGAAQQAASDSGTNISITADNGSVAAWQMGTVNLGGPHKE